MTTGEHFLICLKHFHNHFDFTSSSYKISFDVDFARDQNWIYEMKIFNTKSPNLSNLIDISSLKLYTSIWRKKNLFQIELSLLSKLHHSKQDFISVPQFYEFFGVVLLWKVADRNSHIPLFSFGKFCWVILDNVN